VCHEDLARKAGLKLQSEFFGFREYFESRPLSRVLELTRMFRLARALGRKYWLGHVNASPTQAGAC